MTNRMTWGEFKSEMDAKLKAKVPEGTDIDKLAVNYIDIGYTEPGELRVEVTEFEAIEVLS